jgi:hypothetical protein
MTVVPHLTAPTFADRMSIVESDQPLAIGSVKRQRIVEPVWSFSGNRHAPDDKLNPITTRRIDDEHLPVQIEQHVESAVARRWHATLLSL